MKTKKYPYPNLMFVNKFTYDKLEAFASEIDLIKLHLDLRCLRDFKIVVVDGIENDEVYFYVNRFKGGEIVSYNFKDLLR